MIFRGFEPVYFPDSEILILGSFPSVKSREVSFYYGNPLNRFWRVLAEIYREKPPENTAEKILFLKNHRLALWDIVTECEIEGSLDSAIKNPKIANLYEILNAAPIAKIIANGGKSFSLVAKHYPELANITTKLPSTSPANTRFSKDLWEKALL